MYSIGQVSEKFNLPVSTLRYYDKEGLLPNIERSSGIRKFSDRDLETLNVIECLKKSGLEIKDIRQFIQWCAEGNGTYSKRLELFIKQKENVENNRRKAIPRDNDQSHKYQWPCREAQHDDTCRQGKR